MKTQAQMIIDYIERHGSITALAAQAELGVMRLAARMHEIARYRFVKTEMVRVTNRRGNTCMVARYSFMRCYKSQYGMELDDYRRPVGG